MSAIDTQAAPVATTRRRPAPSGIPLHRITTTELRKSFDTRSGLWLMVSIAVLAVLATAAVVVFAPDDQQTYSSFAAAVGVPMTVILPIIAILSVTGEWSQRTGLTTFTLVPRRGRVILAKVIVSVGVGVASILLAAAIGAVGNIVGSAIAGVDTTWDLPAAELAQIVLANVLGLLVGFMLGVLLRSSAAAIVAYFVYSFVVPTLAGLLAASQGWFHDLQPWVDFNFAQSALYDQPLTSAQWAHLAVTSTGWLILPTALGVWLVMRAEVK
jgi:ABC-type transport system involved in multi-copper enzyme maturation permease subunit